MKKAFTLAEVLITLGIIGVVAALTIPTVISNYRKTIILTQLKKNYSLAQSTMRYAESQYEAVRYWENFVPAYGDILCNDMDSFVKKFVEGIKVARIYDSNSIEQHTNMPFCGSDVSYDTLNYGFKTVASGSGDARQKTASVMLPDGACWLFYFKAENHSNSLVRLYIDVNGPGKQPNRQGIDLFQFIITPAGQIVPNSTDDCKNVWNDNGMGQGCASKIINDGWQIKKDYPWNW